MKICIASQTFAPQDEGGAEIFARMAAYNLVRRGNEVVVLSLGMAGDEVAPVGRREDSEGFAVERLAYHNSYLPGPRRSTAGAARKLEWHVRAAWGALAYEDVLAFFQREKFDLLYAHNTTRMQPALFRAARALKLPIYLHLHDYAVLCPKTSMYRGERNCEQPCLDCRLLTSRLGVGKGEDIVVISVSDAVRRRIVKHGVLTEAKWHILHNMANSIAKFDGALVGRKQPAAERFTFGYLGALTEAKGVAQLIQAFAGLEKADTAQLLVAGRGNDDYVAHVKALAGDKPVRLVGHVKPEEIFGQADAIVVPSLWQEPQSLVLIESSVYGVPLIATLRGGTTEILKDYGTGWGYDPDQPGALSAQLSRALEIGQSAWWAKRDELFPGISSFKGTAESSHYYDRLSDIMSGRA